MQFKTKSFFLTLLLIVIVLAMGLSGIEQVFTKNNNYVAKIGKNKISTEEYQRAYDIEKINIQRMLGATLSNEQLQTVGLNQIVLDKLIQGQLLDNLANSINLDVSDQSIATEIRKIPDFQDEKGNFDKDKFLSLLGNDNVNESLYIEHIKGIIIRNLILDSFKYIPGSHSDLANKIYNYRFEERIVDVSVFTPSMVKEIPEPSEEILREFYQRQQEKFWLPEQKKVEYLVINSNNVDTNITLDETEVLDSVKDQEDRIDITYIMINNSADANNISRDLKEKKKKITDLEHKSMENLSKSMLPDNLQEIFSLKEHEISNPIKTPYGFFIFCIEKKYKISEQEKKKIELEIRKDLINNKINMRLEDFVNSLEEELSSGTTMNQLAKTYNLQVNEIGPIDNRYHNQKLVKLIFSKDHAEGNYLFTSFTDDNGIEEYYSVNVTENIAPKLKEFDKYKNDVKQVWESEFIKNELYKIAQHGKLNNNISQKKIVRTSVAYTESPEQNYPDNFVDQVFRISLGESTIPVEYQNDRIIIGKLISIQQPKENRALVKEIEREVNKSLLQGIYSEFKHHLQNKFTVSVNKIIQ